MLIELWLSRYTKA